MQGDDLRRTGTLEELEKEEEYRVLRIFREQPLAVRKVVEQDCSHHGCNDY